MLFIQYIVLLWTKEYRGAPYSKVRVEMPQAYKLPENFFRVPASKNILHSVFCHQDKDRIFIHREAVFPDDEISGIRIKKIDDQYHIYYQYEYSMGLPVRDIRYSKRKQEYKSTRYLNKNLHEKAFILEKGMYGRIVFNGRHSASYECLVYEQDIINFVFTDKESQALDMFTKKEPDIFYTQIEHLF